jgi:autotransporter-associated beta strand protein
VQVPHNLAIGNNKGIAGSAVVIVEASSQIASTTAVTVNADSILALVPGVTEAVGSLAGKGFVNYLPGGTPPAVLSVGGNSSITFAGQFGGAGTLQKQGTGTLTLSGASPNFKGQIQVSAGTLIATNAQAFGASTVVITVSANATLELAGGASGINAANPLILNGNSTFGPAVLLNASGNNTWSGPISLADQFIDDVNAAAGTNLTLRGVIQAAATLANLGTLHKKGAGTVTQSNANSYYGVTEVDQGTLDLAAYAAGLSREVVEDGATLGLVNGGSYQTGGVLYLNGSGALLGVSGNNTWDGPISLNNTTSGAKIGANSGSQLNLDGDFYGGNFTKTGGGTVILNLASGYGGTTTVSQGILEVSNSSALSSSSSVTVANGQPWSWRGVSVWAAHR